MTDERMPDADAFAEWAEQIKRLCDDPPRTTVERSERVIGEVQSMLHGAYERLVRAQTHADVFHMMSNGQPWCASRTIEQQEPGRRADGVTIGPGERWCLDCVEVYRRVHEREPDPPVAPHTSRYEKIGEDGIPVRWNRRSEGEQRFVCRGEHTRHDECAWEAFPSVPGSDWERLERADGFHEVHRHKETGALIRRYAGGYSFGVVGFDWQVNRNANNWTDPMRVDSATRLAIDYRKNPGPWRS